MPGIITLITDWSNSDYYIGAVKAKVLSKFPDVNFIDISHNVSQYSVAQAAFIARNTYTEFPKGSIHLIAVDSEPDQNGKILVINHNEQYFVLNDNGMLSLIFKDEPQKVFEIETGFGFEGASFSTHSIFSEIVLFILKGGDLEQLGSITTEYKKIPELLPQLETDMINGEVIYIDSFGNAITNIESDFFKENVGESKFEILLNSNFYKTNNVHNSYKQVDKGEIVCIFNSLGLLEVAIREGNASQLLSLKRKSEIRVKFNL